MCTECVVLKLGRCYWMYSGTSLSQPCLGAAEVAGLVRWLDLEEPSLIYQNNYIG